MSAPAASLAPPRLQPGDLARLATIGVRTRRLRSALSALGIAIGVAAIVAVLGLSSSSQAGLLAEINQLGTNLLDVTTGQNFSNQAVPLPLEAPGMIARIGPVYDVAYTGALTDTNAYRTPLIPAVETNSLSVDASNLNLPGAVGTTVAQGRYLNAATATEPVCVLGAAAARRLGIYELFAGERIWVGGMWFYVAGILNPAALAPEIDSSVLIGFPAFGAGSACWPRAADAASAAAMIATQAKRLANRGFVMSSFPYLVARITFAAAWPRTTCLRRDNRVRRQPAPRAQGALP